jgi:hypothetical protein
MQNKASEILLDEKDKSKKAHKYIFLITLAVN